MKLRGWHSGSGFEGWASGSHDQAVIAPDAYLYVSTQQHTRAIFWRKAQSTTLATDKRDGSACSQAEPGFAVAMDCKLCDPSPVPSWTCLSA